jgi:addiction module HigA family antidote
MTTEVTMSSMFNPPHPGLTLRDDILPALNLQVGEAAAQLGVDRTTLSKVVNGRAAISPSMALRIERWLGRDHGGADKCGWPIPTIEPGSRKPLATLRQHVLTLLMTCLMILKQDPPGAPTPET